MALTLRPTTELEAINLMLLTIGEQPINSLEFSGISEGSMAQTLLHNTSRQVQANGIHCNTENNYPLTPDVDGNLWLPTNCLKIDTSDQNQNTCVRGNRLYNLDDHTFVFPAGTVEVDLVWFLAFTDLPQAARDFVTIKACRIFAAKVVGSESLVGLTQQDEMEAWRALVANEVDSGDYNMLYSPDTAYRLRRW